MTKTLTPELKPCPFCGGANLYVYKNLVECRNPECGGSGPDVGDTQLPDAAKDAWNTRPVLSADPEALTIAHMHGAASARDEIERLTKFRDDCKAGSAEMHRSLLEVRAENARLIKERDEALCKLIAAGSEKPTAEDMDWAISLSASLRREEITVEDNEITRLTSQLEQAERVIAPFANCLFGGSPGHVHFSAASQWIKDSQAKGEAS